ncbi:MAG: helix-turn-helix domain-containing protein [Limisphaerales bacterium]
MPTGTTGDLIRTRRQKASLTREQLSRTTGVPVHWLGRWERDRLLPTRTGWEELSKVLTLSPLPDPLVNNFSVTEGKNH